MNEKGATTNPIEAQEKETKVSRIEIYDNISAVMNGFRNPNLPPFEQKFKILRDEPGRKRFIEILDDSIVIEVSRERIVDSVGAYLIKPIKGEFNKNRLEPHYIDQLVKHWAMITPTFKEEIHPVLLKSTPGFTYRRLGFDFIHNHNLENAPLFKEFLSRINSPDQLAAWVGSIFVPESSISQYLWIRGGGNDGKSALAHILGEALKCACVWRSPPKQGAGRFWMGGLVGKRMCIVSELDDDNFVNSDLFKSLTGGDYQEVEIKGGGFFNFRPRTKFLFLSNNTPRAEDTRAGLRRLIYADAQEGGEERATYEQEIWAEAPYIFGYCLDMYHKLCPTHAPIPVNKKTIEPLLAETYEKFKATVDRYLKFPDQRNKPENQKDFLIPHRMNEILKMEGIINSREQKHFKKYLEKFGVKFKPIKIKGMPTYVYLGCLEKSHTEKDDSMAVYSEQNRNHLSVVKPHEVETTTF